MSRPTPGVVNADAQLQAKRLKAVVNAARLLGICFLGFGLLMMIPASVAIPDGDGTRLVRLR